MLANLSSVHGNQYRGYGVYFVSSRECSALGRRERERNMWPLYDFMGHRAVCTKLYVEN